MRSDKWNIARGYIGKNDDNTYYYTVIKGDKSEVMLDNATKEEVLEDAERNNIVIINKDEC